MMLTTMMATLAAGVWAAPQGGEAGDGRQAIREAVLDYAEGYYERAPERMTRAISPLLTKRALVAPPGLPPFLSQMNAEMLIEATRGGGPRPPAADRRMVVEVLDANGEVASARVFSVLFNDYVHLARREGRWQLVSVLWHTPPASPAATDAAAAVEQASREYAAAMASKDGQRVLGVLSPVAAIRMLSMAPSGARVLRDQNTEGAAAAVAAGQGPRANPSPEVTVLGIDGDIASTRVGSGADAVYLHLALQQGRWRVVNTLSAPAGR